MIIFVPPEAIAVFIASNELLAELTSKPSTRAVRVASIPAPIVTAFFDASFRWSEGKIFWSSMPTNRPMEMQATLIRPTIKSIIAQKTVKTGVSYYPLVLRRVQNVRFKQHGG